MSEEEIIEEANHVHALEREVTRLSAHVVTSAAGLIDAGVALVDGLYPKPGDERDE